MTPRPGGSNGARFFDNQPRIVSYVVTPAPNAAGTATFIGNYSVDGYNIAVTGQRQTATNSGNELTVLQIRLYPGVTVNGSPGQKYEIDFASDLKAPFGRR